MVCGITTSTQPWSKYAFQRIKGDDLNTVFRGYVDSADDVNGERLGDIIVSARHKTIDSSVFIEEQGSVTVFYGSASEISASSTLDADLTVTGNEKLLGNVLKPH